MKVALLPLVENPTGAEDLVIVGADGHGARANLGGVLGDINGAGATQVAAVGAAGGAQVNLVNAAGATAAATLAAAGVVSNYASNIKAAVGTGSLRCLFDMDGPRTAFSGSSTIMQGLTSLDDTPLSLALHTSIYAGTDPRPVYTARGIYLSSQAGFTYSGAILPKTSGDFAILYSCDLNTLTSTVGTVATLPGSPAEGDMVLVNADTNTTYSPDVALVLDQGFADANLVNGLFRYQGNSASWQKGSWYLFTLKGATSFIQVYMNHLGQLFANIYPGTGGAANVRSLGSVPFGTSKLTIGIRRYRNAFSLIINGRQVYSGDISAQVSITDFATLYINGSGRSANTVQPIQTGLRQYFKGLVIADDLTEASFRRLHDVVAARHVTPALVRSRRIRGLIGMGQSWFQGAIDTTMAIPWTTSTGWNGQVTRNNLTQSGEQYSVTRQSFPNLYSSLSLGVPQDVGLYSITLNSFGNIQNGDTHNPATGGENQLAGFMGQVNSHIDGPIDDWAIAGYGAGGATIAILTTPTTSPLPLVQSLKGTTLAGGDFYNNVLLQATYHRDFANSRGQDYTCDALIWDQGHSDLSNANYVTDFLAFYDRLNADVKKITGQSSDVVAFIQQINLSLDGVANRANMGSSIDQKMLDIEDARGTRPIFCIGPVYQITSKIHPYRLGHRWRGEILGAAFRRVMFNGEAFGCLRPFAYTYSVGGTTIDIDYRVRSGRALTLVDSNDNNIFARQTINGVDTYGYGVFKSSATVTVSIASPGVVTWTAHGLSVGGKVRFTVTEALPTGLVPNTDYFVQSVPTANTFTLAATSGGAAINTTGTQSGVHTAYDVTIGIASVAVTSTNRIRITLTAPITAGMSLQYVGVHARVGNVCDGARVNGIYQDQDWTVPIVANEPTFKLGLQNDIRQWAATSTKVL